MKKEGDRQIIHLWPDLERSLGYSQAAVVGDSVYVAGTVAFGDNGQVVGAGDTFTQAQQVYKNIQRTLERCSGSLHDVVEETIFVTNMDTVAEVIRARREAYGVDELPPATGVEVSKLVLPELLVEVRCTARLR